MVMEYIAGIKSAFELAKAIKISAEAIGDAQIKLQVAELIGTLADLKIEAAENAELIASLQKQLNIKEALSFNGSVYFLSQENGEKDGPWCPTCYDVKQLLVRLQNWNVGSADDRWCCQNCKNIFNES